MDLEHLGNLVAELGSSLDIVVEGTAGDDYVCWVATWPVRSGEPAWGLQAAPVAPGADRKALLFYSLLASPLLGLALAPLARRLAGSLAARAAILSCLIWIAYSVCDQLEGLLVSTHATGFWFAIVASLPASLLCGGALAYLFPAIADGEGSAAARQAGCP